ncbi:hypothetical protein [uncultured Algibacter sp.]|uniref:hypothetical protein n=1 Tax=uncultured Algibacter sp. TaxID=298659 RepID=UPI0032177568
MKELNIELAEILEQFKEGKIDLLTAMEKFDCVFTKFKKHTGCNKFLIDTLESDFSKVLQKLYHVKDIKQNLKNNRQTYSQLRVELGLDLFR